MASDKNIKQILDNSSSKNSLNIIAQMSELSDQFPNLSFTEIREIIINNKLITTSDNVLTLHKTKSLKSY